LVLKEGVILSNELTKRLIAQEQYRVPEARKALRFLHRGTSKGEKEGCMFVTVRKRKSGEPLYFYGRNKVFVSKLESEDEILVKIRNLITRLQKNIIEIFENETFGTNYLSSFEIRKLVPRRGDYISDALNRLKDLGFIAEITVGLPRTVFHKVVPLEEILRMTENPPKDECTFYIARKSAALFEKQKVKAAIEEMTESEIAFRIPRVFRKLYPPGLVESYKETVRTKNKDLMKLAKGISFDVFLHLKKAIDGIEFIGIDVYTRFPVKDEVVRRFHRKIRNVGEIFGLIFVKGDMATKRTSYLCHKYGIGFGVIEDVGINYEKIKKKIKREHSRRQK